MKIEIRDDRAKDFFLFLNRLNDIDAYNKTDCGFTNEARRKQAYRFLEGIASVEYSLKEQIHKQSLKREKEERAQGFKR